MKKQLLKHYRINQAMETTVDPVGEYMLHIHKQLQVIDDEFDEKFIQTIIDIAKEKGVTDLYLINKERVVEMLKKETPAKVDWIASSDKVRRGGYCPTCGGTVQFNNTVLRKMYGACCTWCGQALEWGEVKDVM